MKISLSQTDYQSIANNVWQGLTDLIPDNEYLENANILFSKEFLTKPLRIDTPGTRFNLDQIQHQGYDNVKDLRKQIETIKDPKEKSRKNQQLDSMVLFGQLLFSQSASRTFLQKSLNQLLTKEEPDIRFNLAKLHGLMEQEGVKYDSSKLDALTRRKQFDEVWRDTKHSIKNSSLEREEKLVLLSNLYKAQGFYHQANDLNFKYADKPSRSFSNFVNTCVKYGSKISLAASLIAGGATALAMIPPLAPIMAPIAVVASAIALALSLPLAFKNVGTMLYNLIRFGVQPTPTELINTVLLGTSLLTLGATHIIAPLVNAGILSQTANVVTSGVGLGRSVLQTPYNIFRQVTEENSDVTKYKAALNELKKIKLQEKLPKESTKESTEESTEGSIEEPPELSL